MSEIRGERLNFQVQPEPNFKGLNYTSEEKKVFRDALGDAREEAQANKNLSYNIEQANPLNQSKNNNFIMIIVLGYFIFC